MSGVLALVVATMLCTLLASKKLQVHTAWTAKHSTKREVQVMKPTLQNKLAAKSSIMVQHVKGPIQKLTREKAHGMLLQTLTQGGSADGINAQKLAQGATRNLDTIHTKPTSDSVLPKHVVGNSHKSILKRQLTGSPSESNKKKKKSSSRSGVKVFSLLEKEHIEMQNGRDLLAHPDRSESWNSTHHCSTGAPFRRVLLREIMGIGSMAAEDFFEKSILSQLRSKDAKPLRLVDVGANVGQFAIPMAKRGHTVVSFEPVPSTCQKLKANIAKASVGGSVLVYCAAAAGTKGTVTFLKPAGVPAASYKEVTKLEAATLRAEGKGDDLQVLVTERVDTIVSAEMGNSREIFMLKVRVC